MDSTSRAVEQDRDISAGTDSNIATGEGFDGTSSNKEMHGAEIETTNGRPRRERRGGCLGFLRRWWWLLLIIFIIVVLVVILPVMLVAVPNIIRNKVNGSTLTVDSIAITNTQTNSVRLAFNATISTSGSIHGTVDSFNASLYLTDKQPQVPFAFIEMPSVRSGSNVPVNVSQDFQIYNTQAYADYNTWYLLNESFRMTVEGDTTVHVSGLRAVSTHFQKVVTLTGLNGFKGLNVTQSSVSLEADAQGDNFHGYLTVPNPSVLTLDIGNATFTTLLNNSNIGTTHIDNMFLLPGNNNFSIRANISQSPVIGAVTQQPYCQTGILPLDFLGSSVVNNGQELPYFEAGFRLNRETVTVPVGEDLHVGLGFNLSCPDI